jgi:hypothetical protein
VTVPDDRLLNQLIDTNRELVAVNRQIAESLANIERLYVEQYNHRQEAHRYFTQTIERIGKPDRLSWLVYMLVGAAIASAAGMVFK